MPAVLTLATIATTAAAAGLTYYSQTQNANAQNQMATANQVNANNSYRSQQQQIQARLMEQRSQFVQEDTNRDIEAAKAEATSRLSAAESGLSGVSLDAIIGDTERQRGRANAATQANFELAQVDANNAEQNAYAQTLDRRNSVPFGQYPNALAPLITTAGSAFNAYGNYFYHPDPAHATPQ